MSPSSRSHSRNSFQSSRASRASATPSNWNSSVYHDFSRCSIDRSRSRAGCPTDIATNRSTRAGASAASAHASAAFDDAARDDALAADMPPLSVVGQFTIPPPSARRRDFQALHLDFGLPVVPGASDVARFTALYIDRDRARTTALTRIVRLRAVLQQRAWVEPARLLERLRRYGEANAPVEGILARLVEAADGAPTP